MNSSVISWLSSPPVMANSFKSMDEWDVDYFNDDFGGGVVFGQDFEEIGIINPRGCSSNNIMYSPGVLMEQLHTTPPAYDYSQSFNRIRQSQTAEYPDQNSSPPAPITLSFGNHTRLNTMHEEHVVGPELFVSQSGSYRGIVAEDATTVLINNNNNNNNNNKVQPTKKKTRVRPPSQTYDHIIAERRRREQLSQLFVALSALVPGLKKMDKGSVLEDAIKYLRHLKERVQTLEEKAARHGNESALLVRKSFFVVEDEGEGSSDERSVEQPLPEIEVRTCKSHMLLRVHCEKGKGVLVKLLSKVESLHMSVVNTSSTPFGNVTIDITIIAELEKEFDLTVKQVVMALREALQPINMS